MLRRLAPFVTWGTNPGMVVQVTGRVPELNGAERCEIGGRPRRRSQYMGLEPGTKIEEIRDRSGIHRVMHKFAA